jgi:hypothetical protein
MSLTAIRSYYKARGEAVGLTYHDDAFNIENISSSVIDKAFGFLIAGFSGVKLNQHDQEILVPIEIVFYVKGYRTSTDGLDSALLYAENLIKEVEAPSKRLGQSIKNITLGSCTIEPMESNDNLVRARISFNNQIHLSL